MFVVNKHHVNYLLQGDTIEELKKTYADTIMACAKEFPLTAAGLKQLREGSLPEDPVVKCLFACTYKKLGMVKFQFS